MRPLEGCFRGNSVCFSGKITQFLRVIALNWTRAAQLIRVLRISLLGYDCALKLCAVGFSFRPSLQGVKQLWMMIIRELFRNDV